MRPQGPLHGIRFRAVALGVVVDHVATMVFATLLVTILGGEDLLSGDETVVAAAFQALAGSTDYLVSALLGGLICTVLAGFIGARYAGTHHVRHGAWIAAVSVTVVFVLYPGDLSGGLSWFETMGWLLQLPAGMLGGALALWSEGAADDAAGEPAS